jgi:SulP family sulfate permease
MRRMETVTNAGIINLDDEADHSDDPRSLQHFDVPNGVDIFEIDGPFFFGAANKFQDEIRKIKLPKVLILRMRHVPAIDATGLHALEGMIDSTRRAGTAVIISGIHKQPAEALKKAELIEKIGHDRIHKDIIHAVEQARELLADA